MSEKITKKTKPKKNKAMPKNNEKSLGLALDLDCDQLTTESKFAASAQKDEQDQFFVVKKIEKITPEEELISIPQPFKIDGDSFKNDQQINEEKQVKNTANDSDKKYDDIDENKPIEKISSYFDRQEAEIVDINHKKQIINDQEIQQYSENVNQSQNKDYTIKKSEVQGQNEIYHTNKDEHVENIPQDKQQNTKELILNKEDEQIDLMADLGIKTNKEEKQKKKKKKPTKGGKKATIKNDRNLFDEEPLVDDGFVIDKVLDNNNDKALDNNNELEITQSQKNQHQENQYDNNKIIEISVQDNKIPEIQVYDHTVDNLGAYNQENQEDVLQNKKSQQQENKDDQNNWVDIESNENIQPNFNHQNQINNNQSGNGQIDIINIPKAYDNEEVINDIQDEGCVINEPISQALDTDIKENQLNQQLVEAQEQTNVKLETDEPDIISDKQNQNKGEELSEKKENQIKQTDKKKKKKINKGKSNKSKITTIGKVQLIDDEQELINNSDLLVNEPSKQYDPVEEVEEVEVKPIHNQISYEPLPNQTQKIMNEQPIQENQAPEQLQSEQTVQINVQQQYPKQKQSKELKQEEQIDLTAELVDTGTKINKEEKKKKKNTKGKSSKTKTVSIINANLINDEELITDQNLLVQESNTNQNIMIPEKQINQRQNISGDCIAEESYKQTEQCQITMQTESNKQTIDQNLQNQLQSNNRNQEEVSKAEVQHIQQTQKAQIQPQHQQIQIRNTDELKQQNHEKLIQQNNDQVIYFETDRGVGKIKDQKKKKKKVNKIKQNIMNNIVIQDEELMTNDYLVSEHQKQSQQKVKDVIVSENSQALNKEQVFSDSNYQIQRDIIEEQIKNQQVKVDEIMDVKETNECEVNDIETDENKKQVQIQKAEEQIDLTIDLQVNNDKSQKNKSKKTTKAKSNKIKNNTIKVVDPISTEKMKRNSNFIDQVLDDLVSFIHTRSMEHQTTLTNKLAELEKNLIRFNGEYDRILSTKKQITNKLHTLQTNTENILNNKQQL